MGHRWGSGGNGGYTMGSWWKRIEDGEEVLMGKEDG